MVLQDMASMKWSVKGVIKEGRTSEDGSVRSYVIVKENGRETIRNARHIKFSAIKEKTKVRFAENLIDEAKSDDDAADSESEANTESADSDSMETDTQNEASNESECMVIGSPTTRASVRLARRLAVGQRGTR